MREKKKEIVSIVIFLIGHNNRVLKIYIYKHNTTINNRLLVGFSLQGSPTACAIIGFSRSDIKEHTLLVSRVKPRYRFEQSNVQKWKHRMENNK